MLVYDCFTFFNELDLLEVRLNELSDAVDVFVIAESELTFQGQVKPLFFEQNKERFAHFLPRICHIITKVLPDAPDAWSREFHQRQSLCEGFKNAPSDAFIMISDADEIISSDAVKLASQSDSFCFFQMQEYLYYLNLRSRPWLKAFGAPKHFYAETVSDLNRPRIQEAAFLENIGAAKGKILQNAGWHFSWMGGVEVMLHKLSSFSHTEPEVAQWRDRVKLQQEIVARRFFFDKTPLEQVSIKVLPRFIHERETYFRKVGLLADEI